MRAALKFASVAVVLGAYSLVNASSETQQDKIADRIKPVGEVCIEGQACAETVTTTAAAGPRDGKAVFDAYCTACHTPGILGAPKAFDKAAWKTKLAKGFEATLANAINGINAMPPRGTCGDCSDEEIGNAIKYMSK